MSDAPNFCVFCGAKLVRDARFCEGCGKPVRQAAERGMEHPGPEPEAPPPALPSCPECGSPGEKAKAVVDRLTAVEDPASPSDQELEEMLRREELLRHLSPPEEPRLFPLFHWLVLFAIPGLNVLSVFFSPLKGALKAFVGLLVVVFVGFIVWAVTGTFDDPFAPRDTTMAVGATAFSIYFIALVYSWFAERSAIQKYRWPRFQKTIEAWRHLRFCEPCGLVFLESQPGASAPVDGTRSFLARQGDETNEPELPEEPRGTPVWLWVVLLAILAGGASLAYSAAPGTHGWEDDEAVLDTLTVAPWDDLEADPLASPGEGGLDLDKPLMPDSSGGGSGG